MKHILIINTGGTFSSSPGSHGLEPGNPREEILEILESFAPELTIELEDYCFLDSSNITPDHWSKLAERIQQANSYEGIVIIHGTDTMSYTASMLSFMLQGISIPVVLTGSQLPIGVPLSDAQDNLKCAIQMAGSGSPGVFVVFDRKIMLGCRTSKVRTVSFNAFESINYPYVGEFNAFGMQLREEWKEKKGLHIKNVTEKNGLHLGEVTEKNDLCSGDVIKQKSLNSDDVVRESLGFQAKTAYSDKIAVLKLFPGMHSDIFSFLGEHGYEGIYIEGFGLGGVPFLKNNLTAEIQRASEKGMPILVGSQCRYEGSNLNIYETGQRVLECGGIPVHDMTQEAVVTKLMWCLGQTKDREEIQTLFGRSLVGEVTI